MIEIRRRGRGGKRGRWGRKGGGEVHCQLNDVGGCQVGRDGGVWIDLKLSV